jgi:hypothetical protein
MNGNQRFGIGEASIGKSFATACHRHDYVKHFFCPV